MSVETALGLETAERESDLAPRINFLDPTVPFGEGMQSVVASVMIHTEEDGSLTELTKYVINDAVGESVAALHTPSASETSERVGADTDPFNPLALTEREAAIAAKWKEQENGAPVADVEIEAQSKQEDTLAESPKKTILNTRIGRTAARIALGIGGLIGGFAAQSTPAAAHPNQIPLPAPKTAEPFSGVFSSMLESAPENLSASSSTTSTVSVQQCIQEGIEPPQVISAKLFEAGKSNQAMKVVFKINALDAGCAGQADRYLAVRILMQNGRHLAQKVYLDPGEESTWKEGGALFDGSSTGGPVINQNVHSTKDDYYWVCGHKKPTVEVQTANRVEDPNGNLLAGPKIATTKAQVLGAKCHKP